MSDDLTLAARIAALDTDRRVAFLRALVDKGEPVGRIPAVVPLRAAGTPSRVSPAQEDLWVFETMYPESAAINLCGAYHFDRGVERTDLREALDIVLANHDILRCAIAQTPAGLMMVPGAADRLDLPVLDLRDAGTEAVAAAIDAFRRRTFQLDRELLIRAQVIRADAGRCILLLGLHHIVTDWWSFDVLHTEFAEAYRAVTDPGSPLPERPATQYADYAAWQHELDRAGVLAQQLDFWRRYLADPPRPPAAAAPLNPLAPVGFAGGRVRFDLPSDVAAAVRHYAREHRTTVFTVLIAAFAVFAHRVSGEADLLIGTPTANRSAKGLERVIGYVMNIVATRWRIGPDTSFADLVTGFAAEFADVLANAQVPNGRIIAAVNPERPANRAPLFQWVFMHLPEQQSTATLPEGARFERLSTGTEEHDFVLILRDRGAGISGTFEYRADLFAGDVVRAWSENFPVLLGDLLTGHAVAGARILGPRQRTVIDSWTGGPSLPAFEGFDADPAAPAVSCGGDELSYAELAGRSDRLAWFLRGAGGTDGATVGLCLTRSVSTVVAMLAVLKAGAAFLPLDPAYPPSRLAFMLDDCAATLIVTDTAVAGTGALGSSGLPLVVLDGPDRDRIDAAARIPLPTVTPADLAYVIYTSGSTGLPKGVGIPHGALRNLSVAQRQAFEIKPADRVVQFASVSFDASIEEIFPTLLAGAHLQISGGTARPSVTELLDAVREQGGTVLNLPTAYWQELVTVLASGATALPDTVRLVVIGGEAYESRALATWFDQGIGARLVNTYGPTEATVTATSQDLTAVDATRRITIGRPIAGTRSYVLDARLAPVPVGVAGELYLAGSGLAQGYLGRRAATAGRFVADPYAADGTRMYRTGDLVRWRGDGVLEFVGRADSQTKLRGFRIEIGEIGAALGRHPDVSATAVIVREDRPGDRRLVAYVVPAPGSEIDPDAIRSWLAATLPEFMVPAAVVPLAAMPRSVAGKVDRSALPVPDYRTTVTGRAPSTARESALCLLFGAILAVPEVGVDDGFFQLGGNSLLATRLTARARSEFGLDLSIRDIFEAPTVAALALRATAPRRARPVLGRRATSEAAPATAATAAAMKTTAGQTSADTPTADSPTADSPTADSPTADTPAADTPTADSATADSGPAHHQGAAR